MNVYFRVALIVFAICAFAWVSNDDFDAYQIAHSGGVYASAK